MRVRIVVAGGGAEERAIESEADVVTIGSEADVVLDHAAVAKHAITLRRQTSGDTSPSRVAASYPGTARASRSAPRSRRATTFGPARSA